MRALQIALAEYVSARLAADVVEVLVGILGVEEPTSVGRAEALASAFDGILLAALLKTPAERTDILASALALTMHPLAR